MKMNVVGHGKPFDYVDKKTHIQKNAIVLHCTYKDRRVTGDAVYQLFIDDRYPILDQIFGMIVENVDIIGRVLDVDFDFNGYVSDINFYD